ncbi:MAG: M43 family zinc metalloprotease, partial [Bacteroidota bacterium]
MIRLLLLLPILFLPFFSAAQSLPECASHLLHDSLLQHDAGYAQRVAASEAHIQSVIQNAQNAQNANAQFNVLGGVLQVPVVVHIVHTGQAVGVGANISLTQINSAITALNDRFRKTPGTHGDAGGVDVEIEFCLAQRDPDCNPTTGINRIDGSSVALYSTEGITAGQGSGAVETDIKDLSRWPSTDYVNVWVVTEIEDNDGLFGIQGYAYFPGASSDVDGIVIMHTAFGTTGTVNNFNNLNRTFTHEFGHYFNLFHTFEGDNNGNNCPPVGNNCGSGLGDCVTDTDRHIRSASNCPTGQINTCTGDTFGPEINNYMDFSSQLCANEYTAGQKTRMRAALCGPRAGLLSSLGCVAPGQAPPGAAACTPQTQVLPNVFGMGVLRFEFNELNVTSGTADADSGYVDFTCTQATDLFPSTTYPIEVFTGTTNNQDVEVYIDYNDDGDFTDPGEDVFSSTNDTLHTGNITTPASPTMNTYIRLRVISDFFGNNITGSCYNPQHGQAEDYAVQFISPLALTTAVTDVSCNGAADGAIDLSVSGGNNPYTYAWSHGPTTEDVSGLAAGTYSVVVTDSSGTVDTAFATVTEPTLLVAGVNVVSNVSCLGGSDGTAMCQTSGGTPPYTFVWSNGDPTCQLSNAAAGTYTLTITDANGCIASTSVSITEPATALSASSTSVNVSINGGSDGSIDLTATGGTPPYTYLWSSGQTTEDISNLTAGMYTVTVTDANGCTTTHTVMITQPPASGISLSTAVTDATCGNGSDGAIDLTVSGGTAPLTYLWDNAATTEDISNLAPATYTVTVTDAGGTTATTSATVSSPPALSIPITIDVNVLCNGGSTGQLTAAAAGGTPPYTYFWSNLANTPTISGLSSSTYSVTVTDANGCSVSSSAFLGQPAAISIAASVTNVSIIGGSDGAVDITPTGGAGFFTYAWSNGSTNQDISNVVAGTYTVTVTDLNGCTMVNTSTVTQPAGGISLGFAVTAVSCNGGADGAIDLTVSGGTMPLTYAWNNAATTEDISNLTAGTYTVTVTDGGGATASNSVVVTEPTALQNNGIITTDVTCNGGNDGTAICPPGGGTPPYSFAWTSGGTGATETGLAAGTYTVTVTDANGCTIAATATINEPAAIALPTTSINVSVFGGNDGSIDLTPSGGTPAYSFNWSNGASTEDINTLMAGTYTVTVTDANGCTGTTSVVITQPSGITLATAVTDLTCNGIPTGAIDLTVTGGAMPYAFLWSNAATTEDLTGLSAGTYTVTVTDANGATETASATVSEPAALAANIGAVANVTCNGASDGTAMAMATGGTPPYAFAWSNGQNTAMAIGLSAGPQDVTVTDANGCTAVASTTITEPTAIAVSIANQSNASCNGSSDGSATANAAGGTPPFAFTWSNGQSGATITTLAAGVYDVTATDASGCTATGTATITEPAPVNASITPSGPISVCEGATVTLSATLGAGLTYQWVLNG